MVERRRDAAARTADRVRRLSELSERGYEENVRAALDHVWALGGRPANVRVRWEFVRRDPPWTGAPSDSRLPPLPQRPPAARLLSPRGLALQLFLTGLLAAVCTTRRGATFVNPFPLRPERRGAPGWSELVAAPTEQSPGSASRQATPRDNRVRQLKSALDKLASDEVRLVGLGEGRGKYERFRLNHEGSSEGMADDVPYTVPRNSDDAVVVPARFFLNGWHHALTGSEVLAYLALHELRRLNPAGHDEGGVRLTGAARIASFGLSKDTYEDFGSLAKFGLVDAEADPNRRDDGTFEGFSTGTEPTPNRYRLVEGATDRPGLETVLSVLTGL